LQRDGAAVIVTGDFNTEAGSPAYRIFAEAGFIDAHAACGNDDDPSRAFTYHGWQGEAFRGSDSPPRRIDWALLRDGASVIVRDAAPLYRAIAIRWCGGDQPPISAPAATLRVPRPTVVFRVGEEGAGGRLETSAAPRDAAAACAR
jgi:hypothetical protein